MSVPPEIALQDGLPSLHLPIVSRAEREAEMKYKAMEQPVPWIDLPEVRVKQEPPDETSPGVASSSTAMEVTEESPNDSQPRGRSPPDTTVPAVVLKPRAKYKSSPMRVDVVESLDRLLD